MFEGYILVKKENLNNIAYHLKRISGETGNLLFYEDFERILSGISDFAPAPSSETKNLSKAIGDRVSAKNPAGGYFYYDDYVCVGYSSSKKKVDAVWSFTPSINATSATFTLSWDNRIGSVGWASALDYNFEISTNGVSGQWINTNDTISGTIERIGNAAGYGTVTITFNNIALTAGNTYYLRANTANSAYSTLKAFKREGNTVTLTT